MNRNETEQNQIFTLILKYAKRILFFKHINQIIFMPLTKNKKFDLLSFQNIFKNFFDRVWVNLGNLT